MLRAHPRELASVSAILLVCLPAVALGSAPCDAVVGDCVSATVCTGRQVSDSCKPPRGGQCQAVEGTGSGSSVCCGCQGGGWHGAHAADVVSCGELQVIESTVKDLNGGPCGAKGTALAKRVEAQLRQIATACDHDQVPKEQKAVVKGIKALGTLETKLDALAQAGKITPQCENQAKAVIDALVREGHTIDRTAPCPWATVKVGFHAGAPSDSHCTRISSGPLVGSGNPSPIDVQYPTTGYGSRLAFPATVQLSAPDPSATFSGDCDATGLIDLSRVQRPSCSLSCDCGMPFCSGSVHLGPFTITNPAVDSAAIYEFPSQVPLCIAQGNANGYSTLSVSFQDGTTPVDILDLSDNPHPTLSRPDDHWSVPAQPDGGYLFNHTSTRALLVVEQPAAIMLKISLFNGTDLAMADPTVGHTLTVYADISWHL